MSATFRHFAINADDMEHAKRFCQNVFGQDARFQKPPDHRRNIREQLESL